MKKIIIFACILFSTAALRAQLRSTPAEVTNAFSAAYPTAKNITWRDKITNFEAEFDLSGHHTVAKFNSKGEWISTEQDLGFSDLSASVKDGFNKSKYKDWQVKETKSVEGKDKAILYRLYIDKRNISKRYLYFNTQGQLTKDALTL